MNDACNHTITQGQAGERGSWCCACGVKVYDVDERECKDCEHYRPLIGGPVCNKHLMRVSPDMHVTFKLAQGSCWTAKA